MNYIKELAEKQTIELLEDIVYRDRNVYMATDEVGHVKTIIFKNGNLKICKSEYKIPGSIAFNVSIMVGIEYKNIPKFKFELKEAKGLFDKTWEIAKEQEKERNIREIKNMFKEL